MKALDSYFSLEDNKKLQVLLEDMSINDKVNVEFPICRKSGEYLDYEFSINLIHDKKMDSDYVVFVGRDITERRRNQAMMVQTEKMMTVGSMAAGMAHEINNPLGIILQSTQNILRRISPDREKNREIASELNLDLENVNNYFQERDIYKFFDGIQEAGARAAKIVTGMLKFSRKSDSKMSLADINQVIDNSIDLASKDYDLKKKYDFKRIFIIRDFASELPQIPCIETEIEQVLLNLLKNSAQAMTVESSEIDKPKIIIRTRTADPYLIIEVEDNGPGIEEGKIENLFDPFFTTKEKGHGTGLGLSVSYFIIKNKHKGEISSRISDSGGLLFTIKLPISNAGSY